MRDVDARLGRWMSQQRESLGMSQEAVALQMGMDQPAMSKMERGLRRIAVADLIQWAGVLNLQTVELCDALDALREETQRRP